MQRVILLFCLIFFYASSVFALSEADLVAQANYVQIKTLSGYPGDVLSVSFSPNGKIMASGTTKNTIVIWDMATWKTIATLDEENGFVTALAFSSDGKLLASGNDKSQIFIWDTTTWKKTSDIKAYGRIDVLTFSPMGDLLAAACNSEKALLWDVKNNSLYMKQIMHERGNRIRTISFNADGSKIATGSQEDDFVRIWDINSGAKIKELIGHVNNVKAITHSRDGKYLASGGDDNLVLLWDAKTGEVLDPLPGHTSKICSLLFSPTSNILVSSDCIIRKGIFGITVRQTFGGCKHIFWDVGEAKPILSLDSSCGLSTTAFSPDAKYFAVGYAAGDQFITIYERKAFSLK